MSQLSFKHAPGQPRLADDGREGADGNFSVQRNRDGNGRVVGNLLVDVVVAFAVTRKREAVVH